MRVVPNRTSRTFCALKVTILTLKQDDKIDEYLNPEYQNEKCQIFRLFYFNLISSHMGFSFF